jgi:hypothetical protein
VRVIPTSTSSGPNVGGETAGRRLTSVNAISGKPNEDAVSVPSGWRRKAEEKYDEY